MRLPTRGREQRALPPFSPAVRDWPKERVTWVLGLPCPDGISTCISYFPKCPSHGLCQALPSPLLEASSLHLIFNMHWESSCPRGNRGPVPIFFPSRSTPIHFLLTPHIFLSGLPSRSASREGLETRLTLPVHNPVAPAPG